MKNGAMNTMPDTVISIPPCSPVAPPAPPRPNRISMASAFFRKLSLSAEQSWHQNSGANLRDVIRFLNMHASAGERLDRFNVLRIFSRNRGNRMNIVQKDLPLPIALHNGEGWGEGQTLG